MVVTLNGEERTLKEGCTIAELIAELGLRQRRIAVEVNRDIVSREEYVTTELHPGDVIEVVHFVGGG
jgi:thiamine biosynthesis protein ThiS